MSYGVTRVLLQVTLYFRLVNYIVDHIKLEPEVSYVPEPPFHKKNVLNSRPTFMKLNAKIKLSKYI